MTWIQSLFHWLTGCDYVLMRHSYNGRVRRVGHMPNGTPYVRVHGFSSGPTTLNPDGTCGGDSPFWNWEPLTFSSDSEAGHE